MGTVGLVRALRRCRVALAVGAALALLIALAGTHQLSLFPPGIASKETTTGFATQRLLIDTPTSLLGDAAPKGSTGAAFRASFLGNVVGATPTHAAIARRVGVGFDELGIVGAGAAPPGTMSPAAIKAVEASPPRQKYVLTYNETPGLPLLTVFATAPTEAGARRLAAAGTVALSRAAAETGAAADSARVRTIGTMNSGAKASGPGKATGIAIALLFFVVWVFGSLIVDRILRERHRRRVEAVFAGLTP
jgi:hypothetical protein